jgi:hypothetical protein
MFEVIRRTWTGHRGYRPLVITHRFLGLAAAASLAVVAATVGASVAGTSSGFDSSAQGWTVSPDGSTSSAPEWLAGGGDPGGFIRSTSTDDTRSSTFFTSPPGWAGDRSVDYNGPLTYDARVGGSDSSGQLVIIEGNGDAALTGGTQISGAWSKARVFLAPKQHWISLNGYLSCTTIACIDALPAYDQHQLTGILRHFQAVVIQEGFVGSTGATVDLDNPAMSPPKIRMRTVGLEFRRSSHRFTGRVHSRAAQCVARQRVTVFRKRSGPDKRLAATTTDRSGTWHLAGHHATGRFYASLVQTPQSPGVDCSAARSSSVKVP